MLVEALYGLPTVEQQGAIYVNFKDFTKFLQQHWNQQDRKQQPKSNNILKEIEYFQSGYLFNSKHERYVTHKSCLRYIFRHHDDFVFCEELCNEVESLVSKENYDVPNLEKSSENSAPETSTEANISREGVYVLNNENEQNKSTFELYKTLAEDNVRLDAIQQLCLCQNFSLDCGAYLCNNYRDLFSESDWKRIVYFEQQFASFWAKRNLLPSTLLATKSKWEFYQTCIAASTLADSLSVPIQHAIRENQKRKQASRVTEGVIIEAGTKHRPEIIEPEVQKVVDEHLNDSVCIIVPCIEFCSRKFGAHIFIECKNDHFSTDLDDASVAIRAHLRNIHKLELCEIVFVGPGSIEKNPLQRFKTRDLYYQGKLGNNVIYVSILNNCDVLPEGSNENEETFCCACFYDCCEYLSNPLNVCDFSILSEWLNHVPLPVQILLEKLYVNQDSLRKIGGKNKEAFLKSKISKLYHIFHCGLNILNRNYSGLLQDINSDELLSNISSVSSVFAVTAEVGTSVSISTAERRLKEKSDADACYYNTYIKRYPLLYKSIYDQFPQTHYISLRQCHLVLFLDNLVRLSVHSDPKPGEALTSQICTLPITLKGLPKDSSVTETWHSQSCVEHVEDQCSCKEQETLEKKDFLSLILHLTEEEKKQLRKFQSEAIWGLQQYSEMIVAELGSILHASVSEKLQCCEPLKNQPECDDDVAGVVEEMNISLHEMQLEDTAFDFSALEDTTQEDDKMDIHDKTGDLSASEGDPQEGNDADMPDLWGVNDVSDNPDMPDILGFDDTDKESDDSLEVHDELENSNADSSIRPVQQSSLLLDLQSENDDQQTLDQSYCSSVCDSETNTSLTSGYQCEANQETAANKMSLSTSSSLPEMSSFQRKHVVPPLLCRHPFPAFGRDDDITKLKEILDQVLIQSGKFKINSKDRILFAPDYKIAKGLFSLMKTNFKYGQFLPEFPLLHLRKSKIGNLLKAYKSAGLLQILNYMRDEENEKEWSKLVSIHNIDKATSYIRRIAVALHSSFLITFVKYLPPTDAANFVRDFTTDASMKTVENTWSVKYQEFMDLGTARNGTFAMHKDMMQHADEIIAIATAERQGGPEGYNLLLSAVKTSLSFSFLNAATSYAQFCVQLLFHHYTAGTFHKHLKQNLFSTPHKDGNTNFALDTQREIDHRDVIKTFRHGSTLESLLPRMAVVDHLNDIHQLKKGMLDDDAKESDRNQHEKDICHLGKHLSSSDWSYIVRGTKLIVRQGGLSLNVDPVPKNVYMKEATTLPIEILDKETKDIGDYLITKYAANEGLFSLTNSDIPSVDEIIGPKPLLAKIKRSKGITINRVTTSQVKKVQKKYDAKEEQRQKKVRKELKRIDGMSSLVNACQALLKPDGSKATTNKSQGIKKALSHILEKCRSDQNEITHQETPYSDLLKEPGHILLDLKEFPDEIVTKCKVCLLEFAGVKFKGSVSSGYAYLEFLSNCIFTPLSNRLPHATHYVVCEEKYSFTPDLFKAATRQSRAKSSVHSLHHLQDDNEILSAKLYKTAAIRGSQRGKKMVSNYLAANLDKLVLPRQTCIIVDSEQFLKGCTCTQQDSRTCHCRIYSVPTVAIFDRNGKFQSQEEYDNVKQRKGEAEMSQADWLKETIKWLAVSDIVVSLVTSADIDSIPIHMVAVSLFWPRDDNSVFCHPLYVILQKQHGKFDVFNITKIVETLEHAYDDRYISIKVAFLLCMGGNDFLPRYHGINHDKIVDFVTTNPKFLENLFVFEENNGTTVCNVNKNVYAEIITLLYCPPSLRHLPLNFDEVRQISVRNPSRRTKENRQPQCWLPPKSALERMACLTISQVQYLLSIGKPEADLPNFLQNGGLKLNEDGEVEYDLGPDSCIESEKELFKVDEEILLAKIKLSSKKTQTKKTKAKRSLTLTPGKSPQRKRPTTSTPIHQRERTESTTK